MSKGAQERENQSAPAPTVPAPASGTANVRIQILPESESQPSSRPTSVPDYNVAELAASLHGVRRAVLPIDLCIPIRLTPLAAGAPLRAAFLFSHVDDRLSVAELAASAQIPLADAIAGFRLLAELGVIELRGSAETKAPRPTEERLAPGISKSGLRPKV